MSTIVLEISKYGMTLRRSGSIFVLSICGLPWRRCQPNAAFVKLLGLSKVPTYRKRSDHTELSWGRPGIAGSRAYLVRCSGKHGRYRATTESSRRRLGRNRPRRCQNSAIRESPGMFLRIESAAMRRFLREFAGGPFAQSSPVARKYCLNSEPIFGAKSSSTFICRRVSRCS